MSKLLIQDGIIQGMDVYVEYTFDTDETVIFYDYGLELDVKDVIKRPSLDGHEVVVTRKTDHVSLRGYENTLWMEEILEEYIIAEHTVEEDTP